MDAALAVLGIVVPVFVCAGLGWLWVRAGRPYDRDLITRLIMDIGAPCLVFSGLVSLEVEPHALLRMALASAAAIAAFAVLGLVALAAAGLPRTVYLPPLMFGNTGNLGLPLCLFAFGEPGLALAVAFFATTAFAQYTIGISLWRGHFSATELLRTPLVWSAVLAVAALATGVRLPLWLLRTTELLGGFTIPLMLITLGASLAELGVGELGRPASLSLLRLAMGLVVGVLLAGALGLEGVARGVVIVQCATPVAVFNYLFAQRFDRSPQAVASLVVFSNAFAFAALPLVLHFLV